MLAGPGFGDDSPLTHSPGEKTLPQSIVNLMGTGMSQVLPFKENPDTTAVLA